jgi:hypothetical protein
MVARWGFLTLFLLLAGGGVLAYNELTCNVLVTAEGLTPILRQARLPVSAVRLTVTAQAPRRCLLHWPYNYAFTIHNNKETRAGPMRCILSLPRGLGLLHAS